MITYRLIAAAALGAALSAAPAGAVPLPGTGLEVSGEAALVSDYRFRGISRGSPALTGQLTVAHASGLYVGARGATLDGLDNFRLRDPRLADLGDVQLDLYAGYGADLGLGFHLDAGLIYYAHVGSEGPADHFEPYGSLSYALGPAEATVGARWAPAQRGTGDEDMLYLFGELNAGIPFTPVTLTAHAGRQDWGIYGSYWNWSVGGRYVIGPVYLGLRYVDTDLPSGPGQNAGVVASIGARF